MDRMRNSVKKSHDRIKKGLESAKDFDFYFGEARFIADYTFEVHPVSGKTGMPQSVRGKTIFLATGARPYIPPIKGIESIGYLTNESALQLREKPGSMIVIGGGYVAVEFAHFFEAMGTKVTIVQRNERLVPEEEPEISELLKQSLSRRMQVHTRTEAVEARRDGRNVIVAVRLDGGNQFEVEAQHVLVAAGRKSNADLLQVDKSGIKTDERGYIAVDEYFETTKKNIWSFGDAIGKKMFRHAANTESEMVWHNAMHGKKSRMNYLAVPHAVFSWPEIASVGLTEAQAIKHVGRDHILVGKAMYTEVARGDAMRETEAFTKAVVHRKTGKVLGYHIAGPQASILIQEVVNAMAAEGSLWSLARGIHIHPALSEVVLKAFGKLQEPAD